MEIQNVTEDRLAKRFVVLDRDGTINVDRDYLSDPSQLELIPGAAEGLRRLLAMGLGLVVATNQSGIRRGFFDARQVDAVHARLRELLAVEGVELSGIYSCPHLPDDGCTCRKPRTGLVDQAARDLGFAPAECFVIGDKRSDIELGWNLGATTILVRTGYGAATIAKWESDEEIVATGAKGRRPDFVVADLQEAAIAVAAALKL